MDTECVPLLELAKSRLAVRGGSLVRSTAKGAVTAQFALQDIRRVATVRAWDPFGFVVLALSLGGAMAAKTSIASAAWSWVVAVALVVVAAFSVSLLKKMRLRIDTVDGSVEYDVLDPDEDGVGFAVSLQGLLRREQDAS